MKRFLIQPPVGAIHGTVTLEGSKSISNRLLIMQALCEEKFIIDNLSPSDDSQTLQRLLYSDDLVLNVGAAGTTMRFLISYFSILEGERILTGSERMKQRPVQILVDALRQLGAEIIYLEKDGYPPVKISGKPLRGGKLQIRSDVSSQYISSIMMIAPLLEEGIELELIGKMSSLPYLNMTLQIMHSFGIRYEQRGNYIRIFPGKYISKRMTAESDWSAASYFYSICALNQNSEIRIHGLLANSLQGDHVLMELYEYFGVRSEFINKELIIRKTENAVSRFEFDFSNCPDLAQTVAVTAAGLGVEVVMGGLESLRIKETDRTLALQNELKKFDVEFIQENEKWVLKGKANFSKTNQTRTYEDHRMAMSFAPLCLVIGNMIIEDPDVVNKSYPSFWRDLRSIGFSVSTE